GADRGSGDGRSGSVSGSVTVLDASNPFPPDGSMSWGQALATATRNVVAACSEQNVSRLVFLSIAGIEDPVFDRFEYYLAKREQEEIAGGGGVDVTFVKTAQWYEFAANPAAVSFHDDRAEVQDWLVQPVSADAVADVLE